jgi:hypothetical protein
MNTFRDYYEVLTSSEREAFDLALHSAGIRANFNWTNGAESFEDFIDRSLIWASTPQGQDFWANLAREGKYRHSAKDSRQVRLYVEFEPEGSKTTIAYKDAKAILHPFYDIDGEARYVNSQVVERMDYFCADWADRDGKTTIGLRKDRYQVISLENGVYEQRKRREFVHIWDSNYAEESTLIPVPANSDADRQYRDRSADRLYFKDSDTALFCGFYVAEDGFVIAFKDLAINGLRAVKIYHPEYSGKVVVLREADLSGEYTLLSSKCTAVVGGHSWVNYAVYSSDLERFKEEEIIVEDYQGEWVIKHNTEVVDCGSSGSHRFYIPHLENEGIIDICGIRHSVNLVYHEGYVYLNDEIANDNGVYYCGDCEEYYHEDYSDDHTHNDDEDEEERTNNPRYSYHSQEHYDKSNGAKFKIGFEIEKECNEGCKHNHHEIREASGWVKERDGSLDDYKGYEIVSSTYNLFTDEFMTQAKELEKKFPNLINGNASRNCGGHIHFSKADTMGADLLESICGYLPVLYSIYQHRIGKSYCEVKEKEQMKHSDNKYQAVRVMRSRIEFRIFPAVKNLNTLEWRLGLIRIMAKSPSNDPIVIANKLTDSRTELHKHFAKIFSKSAIMQKAQKALTFAKQFDKNYYNIDLRINLDKIKAKENKAVRQESGKKKRQLVTA